MAPRTRRPGPQRREEIARAALALLGRGGLDAVTAQALADAVGVTTGALFRHFRTLDDVVAAAVHLAATRLESAFPPPAAPVRWLHALATSRAALLAEEPGIAWLLRSERAPASLPPAAVERLARAVRTSRARIGAALRRGVADGSLRHDVPRAVLLAVYVATVHALAPRASVAHRAVRSAAPGTVVRGLLSLFVPPGSEPRR